MSGQSEFLLGDWVKVAVPSLPERSGVFAGVSNRGLVKVQPWSPRLGRLAHSVLYLHPKFVEPIESPMQRIDRYSAPPP